MPYRTLPFGAEARHLHWRSLGATQWDLLVIGGGVVGAGIARDAAGRGLRTALVEAQDWAQGTSSKSSRLVHGGLRYLQTGDLALVWEASSERRRLLELAPHLVQPLAFLFPVYEGGVGFRKLQAGMWLYDALAMFRNIERHQMLDRREALEREPALRPEGLRGGALYYDAWVDDARLALATMHGAHRDGAACVSHATVTGFVRGTGGRIVGARIRDQLTNTENAETMARARVVINATGPWSDLVRQLADPGATPRLRPTKGVHMVLRRERVGNHGAVIFESVVDGRVMFVLPWGPFTYVGTTDTDFRGDPAEVAADRADVDYLLRSVNGLYPEAGVGMEDVVSTWAGLRPLLSPRSDYADELSEGQTSREHEVWRDPSGLVSVAGGKLTTFRVMAADVVDFAVGLLRTEHGTEFGPSRTENLPMTGAPDEPWAEFCNRMRRRAEAIGLGAEVGEHLARFYGTAAVQVLAVAADEPELGRRLLPDLPYIWAEIPHLVRHEMALTLQDALERRLHLLHEREDGGLSIASEVAGRMAAEPGLEWAPERLEAELRDFRTATERDRRFRG